MMSALYGALLVYGIPGVIAGVFWCVPIRRLISYWVGRDVMLSFIPNREHVHHTERILGFTRKRT